MRTVSFKLSVRMLAPSRGALFGSVRTLDRTDTSSEVLSGSVNTIYQADPNSGVLSGSVIAVVVMESCLCL